MFSFRVGWKNRLPLPRRQADTPHLSRRSGFRQPIHDVFLSLYIPSPAQKQGLCSLIGRSPGSTSPCSAEIVSAACPLIRPTPVVRGRVKRRRWSRGTLRLFVIGLLVRYPVGCECGERASNSTAIDPVQA